MISPEGLTASARAAYDLLLRLLPEELRREAGVEMRQVFEDEYVDVRGRSGRKGLAALWIRATRDITTTAIAARWSRLFRAGSRTHGTTGTGGDGMMGSIKDLLNDVRINARGLRRSPGFTLTAFVILALGIGANTTMFTVVRALFLEPAPHVFEPDRLVRLQRTTDGSGFGAMAYPDFQYYQSANAVFQGLSAYDPDGVALTIGFDEGRASGRAWLVSHNYFDVLGARPAAGRWFTEEEDRTAGTHAVAIISHSLWQSAFGGSSSAVGAAITLNGTPFVVVGVAPEGFRGVSPIESPPDVWAPIHAQTILTPGVGLYALERIPGNTWVWLRSVGRLREGVTLDAAQTHMDGLANYLEDTYPEWNEGWGVALTPGSRFHPPDGDSLVTMAGLLMMVTVAVLLIACVNVAILILARGTARMGDVAVRVALGAPRWRIVRILLAESLLIAIVGGLAGVVISFWSAGAVARQIPMSFAVDFRPDANVVAFALLLAMVTAITFGLAPALRLANTDVQDVLKGSSGVPRRRSGRDALVVVQVALSVVLVTAAGLVGRSLWTANAEELGFETANRILLGVNLDNHGYEPDEGRAFIRNALERIRSAPGVRSAATMRMVPFRGKWSTTVLPPSDPASGDRLELSLNAVSPGYFETMGMPLVEGRGFTEGDVDGLGFHAAIVNRHTAETLWPGDDPIGQSFGMEDDREPWTVVGVAENARLYELDEEPPLHAYLPVLDWYSAGVVCEVEAQDRAGATTGIRSALADIDPGLAITQVSTMVDAVDQVIGRYKVAASTVGLFGVLALILASVGLYGVLSFSVAQRGREIGIRVALGASASRVGRSVVGRAVALAAVGCVVGLLVSVAASRALAGFLYGVSPHDPATLLLAPALVVTVAVLAAAAPARRATRVDVTSAVKAD